MSHPPAKTCASCGRTIQWRKKWERDWDDVRYCSTACRKRGVTDIDRQFETAILRLLPGRTAVISPADVLQATGADTSSDEPVRRAARRLVAAGQLEIVQRGRVVDPSRATGAIELRRPR